MDGLGKSRLPSVEKNSRYSYSPPCWLSLSGTNCHSFGFFCNRARLAGLFTSMFYLLKTEPSVYSFSDLQRDKTTVWDGVTNPVAVKNLRSMKSHDRLIIYHTGDEKRAVGTATVEAVEATDPKVPAVRIKAGGSLKAQVTLAEIKENPAFRDSPLVRQARLSVVPLTEEQYRILTAE